MPTPRTWTEQLSDRPLRRRAPAGELTEQLEDLADDSCASCAGTGVTAAGDVCGCVDW